MTRPTAVSAEIDTANDCLVAVNDQGVLLMMPPRFPMPKDKALRLAAWIVALADPVGDDFQKVFDAVRNT